MEPQSRPNDGIARMYALIATLRSSSKLSEPDTIHPTASGGATASWGRDLAFSLEIGPPSKDGSTVYFTATQNGKLLERTYEFNSSSFGGDYGYALMAINGLMPQMDREKEQRRLQELGASCAGVLAEASPASNEFTPLESLVLEMSPESKAILRSLLGKE